MPNYVSVLAKHEEHLEEALKLAGVVVGLAITPAAYEKIKKHLDSKGVPHNTHDTKDQIAGGRSHNI